MRTKYTKSYLQPIIQKAYCWNDVCRVIGVTWNSGTVKAYLRKVADFHEIDYSHFLGKRKRILDAAPDDKIFRKESKYHPTYVKVRFLRKSTNSCAICGLTPTWQDKPIVMVMDHINGDSKDHRLTNLRLVCPNCNSQLPTFCGGNMGRGYRSK